MVPFHSRDVRIGDLEMVAEAVMNNCSNLWTATVKAGEKLVATGADTTAEGAMDAAVERARTALASSTPR
jgi:hypothetical protein